MQCLCSSIVKKQLMALTGLALCGFLVVHLVGNLLILVGARAFNSYAHLLTSNSFIYVAEAGLLAIFLLHILLAIVMTVQNIRARGEQGYYKKVRTGRGATIASSTMPYTGLVILIFLIFHIWHIKFGPHYPVYYQGVEMRDLYRLLLEYFRSPYATIWYVVAQVCLGIHLSHGFSSSFQSLGFNHPRYSSWIKKIGLVYALAMALGFSLLAIYLFYKGGGLDGFR